MEQSQKQNSRPHGPALTRRGLLLSGVAGTAGLLLPGARAASSTSGVCALDRELTQGPYYLDRSILRRKVTEGKPGLPLQLRLAVIDARTCTPLQNAAVEIWHCDAAGIYSGYTKTNPDGMRPRPGGKQDHPPGPPDGHGDRPAFGRPPGFEPPAATDDTAFCRGLQLSDAQGFIEFETIYPGWYVGRDIHIHLKVHVGGDVRSEKYVGGHVSHTGQLFFPDELSDEIANLKPYVARRKIARTQLDEDNVFADSHGTGVMLAFEQIKPGSLPAALIGKAIVRIDPSAIPHGDRGAGARWGG